MAALISSFSATLATPKVSSISCESGEYMAIRTPKFSFAFLVRAFIETMDEISADCVESLEAVGASFWQRVFHGIWPSCIQGYLSWFLYNLEVNIRASTIVGMVGGGGIGMVLFYYLKSFMYHRAAGIILAIAIIVILVELLTNRLRKKMVA